jgi:hypothetical protein
MMALVSVLVDRDLLLVGGRVLCRSEAEFQLGLFAGDFPDQALSKLSRPLSTCSERHPAPVCDPGRIRSLRRYELSRGRDTLHSVWSACGSAP